MTQRQDTSESPRQRPPPLSAVERDEPAPSVGASIPDWAHGPGLIETVWRHRLAIAFACLLAGLLGYVLAGLEPPTYRATARLLLKDPATTSVFGQDFVGLDPQRYLDNERQRVLSRSVLTLATERLGGGATPEGLARRVEVDVADDADLLRIMVSARSPEQAAADADAVAIAYQEIVGARVREELATAIALLEGERVGLEARLAESGEQLAADPTSPAALATIESVSRQIASIDQLAAQLAVDAATFGTGVETFETARIPGSASAPNPDRTAIALALLAFIVSSAYAWWWAGRHLTVDDRMQPAEILRAPLLAEVPRFRRVRWSASADPRRLFDEAPEVAEAYRMAVMAVLAHVELPGAVVAITSATPDEGKTAVASGVAAAAARDHRVLLIDADHRLRGATRLLAAEGLAGSEEDAEEERVPLGTKGRIGLSDDARMWLIPARRPPSDRSGEALRAVRRDVAGARGMFDLSVIDTAPILSVADTSALGAVIDGFVLVVRRGLALEDLMDARRRFDVLHAPLLGYVFNDATMRIRRRRTSSRRSRHRKDRGSRR